MKLYSFPPSPYAARCRMVIHAKNLDVDIEDIPFPPSEEYKRKTVTGRVPALEVDGTILPESTVIAEYLEDLGQAPALRPTDPLERAKMRLLVQIGDLYIMPQVNVLVRQYLAGTRDDAAIRPAIAALRDGLQTLDAYIGGGRYAVPGRFTLADCALAPVLAITQAFCAMFGEADILRDTPKIRRYFDAIREEPAAAKVLSEMESFFQ